jgi:hypothetical protein
VLRALGLGLAFVDTQDSPGPPVAFTSSCRASKRQLTSTKWAHAHGIGAATQALTSPIPNPSVKY